MSDSNGARRCRIHDLDQIKKRKNVENRKVEFVPTSCRICLNDGDIPIFGDENHHDTAEGISILTGVKIKNDDGFPKFLCRSCNDQLQSALMFRQIAQTTDALLKETENISTPKETSDIDEALKKGILSKKYYQKFGFKETLEDEYTSFHCIKCDIDFINSKVYAKHMFTIEHKDVSDMCPFCCRQFKCIVTHLALHKRNKTHQCDVCGQKFMNPSYTHHRESHFDKLPFECQECPYKARFSGDFKIHMRTHTGERPYECKECSRRFISKSNLNRHTSTHNKDYNFECNFCHKGFFTQQKLDEHMTLHIGEKAHKCITCSKSFVYHKSLMRHTLQVHKRSKLRSGRTPNYLKTNKDNGAGEDCVTVT